MLYCISIIFHSQHGYKDKCISWRITTEVCRDRIPALVPSCKKRLMGFFVRLLFFLKSKTHQILNDTIKLNISLRWPVEIKLLLASINGSLHETSLFFVLLTNVEITILLLRNSTKIHETNYRRILQMTYQSKRVAGKMGDFATLTLSISLNSSQMCTYSCKDLVTGYCLCLVKIQFLTVIRFKIKFIYPHLVAIDST